jgi:hypothetical protein
MEEQGSQVAQAVAGEEGDNEAISFIFSFVALWLSNYI